MAIRLIASVFDVMRHERTTPAPVHFHSGPTGRPTVCHDERCPYPRLALD